MLQIVCHDISTGNGRVKSVGNSWQKTNKVLKCAEITIDRTCRHSLSKFGNQQNKPYICTQSDENVNSVRQKIEIMRRAIIYVSALLLATELQVPVHAGLPITDEQIIIKAKGGSGKGTSDKTTVSRKSTNPVNIPVGTRRYRPDMSDSNENIYSLECEYWQGHVNLVFAQYQGEARILVKTPEHPQGRLYRVGTSRNISLPVGSVRGLYSIEVSTSVDMEYSIEFEIVD